MTTVKNALAKLAGYVMLAGILYGLFVVIVVPISMIEKAAAESWPSRRGTITLSYASHRRGARNTAYWFPEICGTYQDTGERFCVTRVRFGRIRWSEGKAQAEEAVAKYPVGREVDIHHAPGNPRNTVLEAVSPWTELYTLLGIGVAFLMLPVVLWVFRKRIALEPGTAT